jgi:hypothetical protein
VVAGVVYRPPKVHAGKFTTPETACTAEVQEKTPPEAASVTQATDDVATLPAESSIFTTGSVARFEPAAAATGWVVNASLVATPAPVGWKGKLVAEIVPDVEVDDAVMV